MRLTKQEEQDILNLAMQSLFLNRSNKVVNYNNVFMLVTDKYRSLSRQQAHRIISKAARLKRNPFNPLP